MKTVFIYFCKFFVFPIINLFTERIEGKENIPQEESFILASNHLNSFDQWFIANSLKERMKSLRFLAAMDSFAIFLQSGFMYYLAEVIVINRKKADRGTILKKLIKSLKNKEIIVLFPEGDTNRGKKLLKGKTGVADLALKTRVPVIPFGMRRSKNPFLRIIEIGKPLYFLEEQKLMQQIGDESEKYYPLLRRATDKIMRKISRLCQKTYDY